MRRQRDQLWSKSRRRLLMCAALTVGATGCAALPAPADLDRVRALLDAPSTEALSETQPALVAESRFHAHAAETARVRRDAEASRLHASIALQRLRTADNLDASGERRALWASMKERADGVVQVQGVGDEAAEVPAAPEPALLATPVLAGPGEYGGVKRNRSGETAVDEALHAAEDARALVLTLVGGSDPRFAEGEALLDVARHAKADGYPDRALARADEAALVFRVIRLTRGPAAGSNPQAGAGGSQSAQAELKGRIARLDAQRMAIESLGNEAACPTEHDLAAKLMGMARQALTAGDDAGAGAYLGEAERHEAVCEASIETGLGKVTAEAKVAQEHAKLKLLKDPRWADVRSALEEVQGLVTQRRLVAARVKVDGASARAAELTLTPPGLAKPLPRALEPTPDLVPDALAVPPEEAPAAPAGDPELKPTPVPPTEDPAAAPVPVVPDPGKNAAEEPKPVVVPTEDPAAAPVPVVPDKDAAAEPKLVVPAEDAAAEPKPAVPAKDRVVTPKPVVPAKDPVVTPTPAVPAKDRAVTPKPAVPAKDPVVTPKPAVPAKDRVVTPKPVVPAKDPVVTPTPAVPTKDPVVTPKPAVPTKDPVVTPKPAVPTKDPVVTPKPAVPTKDPVVTPKPAVPAKDAPVEPKPATPSTEGVKPPTPEPAPANPAAAPKARVPAAPANPGAPAISAPGAQNSLPAVGPKGPRVTPVVVPIPIGAGSGGGSTPAPDATAPLASPKGAAAVPPAAEGAATAPTAPAVKKKDEPGGATLRVEITPVASPPPRPTPAPKTLADLQTIEKEARAAWRAATSSAVKAKASARTVGRREKSAARRVATLSKRFERSGAGLEGRAAQEDATRRDLDSLRVAATQRSAEFSAAQTAYPALLDAERTAAGTPDEAAADSRRRDAARVIAASDRLARKDGALLRRAERILASRAAATERARAVLRRDEVRLEAAVAEHQRLTEAASILPAAADSAAQEALAASARYQAARTAVRDRKRAGRGR